MQIIMIVIAAIKIITKGTTIATIKIFELDFESKNQLIRKIISVKKINYFDQEYLNLVFEQNHL